MQYSATILVLLVALSLRTWMDQLVVLAEDIPHDEDAPIASPPTGTELPGMPVRTSKGEEDMKHPSIVYGHNPGLSQYTPITVRPANYSAHFSKESGQFI